MTFMIDRFWRIQLEFIVVKSNKVWVTDTTYLRAWQGWLYLVVGVKPVWTQCDGLVNKTNAVLLTGAICFS